ncbi:MAG: DUF2164 domain-containing protein [bacterium]|jgi:uncharacterized protein (DUF2164 family)
MQRSLAVSKEKKDGMIKEIKAYFQAEREEEIGDLGAGLLLKFILEKLAPEFYNQGIYDSYQYMQDRAEDLLGLQK